MIRTSNGLRLNVDQLRPARYSSWTRHPTWRYRGD